MKGSSINWLSYKTRLVDSAFFIVLVNGTRHSHFVYFIELQVFMNKVDVKLVANLSLICFLGGYLAS